VVLLIVVVAVAAGTAATVWVWVRRGAQVSRDADRFAAARAMTNRWAEDPTSAPKPVLDIARQRTASATPRATHEIGVEAKLP